MTNKSIDDQGQRVQLHVCLILHVQHANDVIDIVGDLDLHPDDVNALSLEVSHAL